MGVGISIRARPAAPSSWRLDGPTAAAGRMQLAGAAHEGKMQSPLPLCRTRRAATFVGAAVLLEAAGRHEKTGVAVGKNENRTGAVAACA